VKKVIGVKPKINDLRIQKKEAITPVNGVTPLNFKTFSFRNKIKRNKVRKVIKSAKLCVEIMTISPSFSDGPKVEFVEFIIIGGSYFSNHTPQK
jgi:hypothetical protein